MRYGRRMRAIREEAQLACSLPQGSYPSNAQQARFLAELGDRAHAQIGQLREVIASVSDLIEPLHIGTTP